MPVTPCSRGLLPGLVGLHVGVPGEGEFLNTAQPWILPHLGGSWAQWERHFDLVKFNGSFLPQRRSWCLWPHLSPQTEPTKHFTFLHTYCVQGAQQ